MPFLKHFVVVILFTLLPTFLFSQGPGNAIVFPAGIKIHRVNIQFFTNNWYDTLSLLYTQNSGRDTNVYLKCDITLNGLTISNCGARFKGNSSYTHPNQKKSFKLSFDEYVPGQNWDSLEKINLNNQFNDPTFMREKLYLDFCQFYGVEAPRCQYVALSVNGQQWGFYTVIEEIDKVFLNKKYANKGGNLFKGDPRGDLKWEGANQTSYYDNYELHTNELANDWSDLVQFLNKINNTPNAQFEDTIKNYFNVYQYVKHYASTMMYSYLDSYTGSGHNYYLYYNTDTKKFEFIEWDTNGSFGRHRPQNQPAVIPEEKLHPFWLPTPVGTRPLHEKIMKSPNLKTLYTNELCYILTNYFTTSNLNAKIDLLADSIRSYVYADTRKQFSSQLFESNQVGYYQITPGLKNFVKDRYAYLKDTLKNYGCDITEIEAISVGNNQFSLYPNPTNDIISVIARNEAIFPTTAKVFDLLGNVVFIDTNHLTNRQIDLSNRPNGIYFLHLGNTVHKIIKL